ncbi:CopD family protein [Thiofilum flexile]|uniref:CopD family protein n=1 Tax=Thiofilum flexile TaxID=125627 RepID=UPI00037ACEA2|nr:CopD family protein [Thiofilum flexile]
MSIALALHVLAVVIWVGGMFFAYMILRPIAASQLDAPTRLSLWSGVFDKFFPWVIASIVLILISGYWMIFGPYGGMKNTPIFVHIMQLLGLIMMAIFGHVFFAPYKRLKQAVASQDWANAGAQLNQIRMMIGINLSLGLITIVIAAAGKYWL